jgi:uncharacterized protein (TIGR02268 family)
VSSSSLSAFLGLLLVWGASVAHADEPSTVSAVRRIELVPGGAPFASEIVISAELSTGLFFDSTLLREGVELEGRERFSLVDVGQATLRLVPSPRVSAGEQFRLNVRFQDGAAPTSASFLLRVHPAKAEPLVEVYRRRRTVETYQQEAREVREELGRCQSENARLLAEQNAPMGLAGLVSTGALDERGVMGRVVTKDVQQSVGAVLGADKVRSYRSAQGVAVEIQLTVGSGTRPWIVKGALLRGSAGGELKVLRLWQEQPISARETGRVVVEAEAEDSVAQDVFSLKLWEDGGPRAITLSNVTFP